MTEDRRLKHSAKNHLLEAYVRIGTIEITESREAYRKLEKSLTHQWEIECLKYEGTMEVTIQGESARVPRRNYANAQGTVNDCSLFPYHTSCYPLLDAYDCLYENQNDQPIEQSSICPSCEPSNLRRAEIEGFQVTVEGFMPNSVRAISEALIQANLAHDTNIDNALISAFKSDSVHLATEVSEAEQRDPASLSDFWFAVGQQDISDGPVTRADERQAFGPLNHPLDRRSRVDLLLKILKHALSELQKDYRLAAAILVRLHRNHDLDDVEAMQRLLVVLTSEYVVCGQPCSFDGDCDEADHFCRDTDEFYLCLESLLFEGLTFLSSNHSVALVGFIHYVYHREFGHLAADSASENATEKRKLLLKRNIVAQRNENDLDDESDVESAKRVPTRLIYTIVKALKKLSEQLASPLLERERCSLNRALAAHRLDSMINCTRCLVAIGEASLIFLPSSDRFDKIANVIASALGETCASRHFLNQPDWQLKTQYTGLRSSKLTVSENRLASPFRFADCIDGKSLIDNVNEKIQDSLFLSIDRFFGGNCHPDIKDVVRGLFVKQVVDVREVGFGYGDFLVWCGYEVIPDPVLYSELSAFPAKHHYESDSDDESTSEEDDSYYDWDYDKKATSAVKLTSAQLFNLYSLSLMNLGISWVSPWTSGNQASFQPQFRDAAETVTLCTHHFAIPWDVNQNIISFVNRNWWPDARLRCHNQDCDLEQVFNEMENKVLGKPHQPKTHVFLACPHCKIVTYCSQKCCDSDQNHKKSCTRMTISSNRGIGGSVQAIRQAYNSGEYQSLFADTTHQNTDMIVSDGEGDCMEDINDNDSWESINSDEPYGPGELLNSAYVRMTDEMFRHFDLGSSFL